MKSAEISMFATICLVSAGAAIAVDMPPLARKDTCTDCHAIDRKIVGPAWMDISRRYKDVPEFEYKGKIYSLEDGLVMKISRGGSGNWGAMPMPKNDPGGAKEADYRELVRFILSLAK